MRRIAVGLACLVGCGGGASAPPGDRKALVDEPQDRRLIPGVDLPEVDIGYLPTSTKAPLVRVTTKDIFVEGIRVISLTDGKIDAKDREHPEGVKVPRLVETLAGLSGGKSSGVMPRPPLVLALDRTSTFGVVVAVIYTAKQKEAGWKHFSLLATSGDKLVALPIALPDMVPSTGAPAGRITVASPPPSSSGLTPDQVLRKIQTAYLAGIKRCYRNALTKDPAARGKVVLSLEVLPTGRVKDGKAKGFDADLDRCITSLMASWTFPAPTEPSTFETTLQLVPDDESAASATPSRKLPSDVEAARLAELLTEAPDEERAKKMRDNPLYVDLEDEAERPLRMAVSVTGRDIVVWSFTGREGTLDKPRLKVPRDDAASVGKVRDVLAEIAKKHYGGKQRTNATRSAVFIADEDVPVALVAKLLGAMRGGEGDAAAFPEIHLRAGFR